MCWDLVSKLKYNFITGLFLQLLKWLCDFIFSIFFRWWITLIFLLFAFLNTLLFVIIKIRFTNWARSFLGRQMFISLGFLLMGSILLPVLWWQVWLHPDISGTRWGEMACLTSVRLYLPRVLPHPSSIVHSSGSAWWPLFVLQMPSELAACSGRDLPGHLRMPFNCQGWWMVWLNNQAGGSFGPQKEGIQLCLVQGGSFSWQYPTSYGAINGGVGFRVSPWCNKQSRVSSCTKCPFH